MTTPRLRVQIELDAPCSVRLTAADRKEIARGIRCLVGSVLYDNMQIPLEDDIEFFDFTTPKVTVRQTGKRRSKR